MMTTGGGYAPQPQQQQTAAGAYSPPQHTTTGYGYAPGGQQQQSSTGYSGQSGAVGGQAPAPYGGAQYGGGTGYNGAGDPNAPRTTTVAAGVAPNPGSQFGSLWYPPQQNNPQATWQPGQQGMGMPRGPGAVVPQPAAPQAQAQQQSIMAQALAGGSNAQQTQNFLRALTAANAGGNNGFMSSANPQGPQAQNIIGAPAQGNGNAGSVQYANGFNGGQNDVSYNFGLGARPPTGPVGNVFNPPQGSLMGSFQPGPMGGGFASGGGYGGGGAAGAFSPPAYTGGASSGGGFAPSGGASPSGNFVTAQGTRLPGATGPITPPPTTQPAGSTQPSGGFAPSQPQYGSAQDSYASQPQYTTGGGQVLVSDETEKHSVEHGGKPLRALLGKLGVHEYSYKNPAHGVGRFVSPMAQELQKTELGKSAVLKHPDGHLMVDYGRLGGINLAAAADLHKRVSELEKGIKLSKRGK